MLPPLTEKTLGARIREARINAGISVKEEFKRRLGSDTSTSTINAWEADRKEPKIVYLKAIRRVTGYSIDEIVGPDEALAPALSAATANVSAPHWAVGAILLAGRVGDLSSEDAAQLDAEAHKLAAFKGDDELVAMLEARLPALRRERAGLQKRSASPRQDAARSVAGDKAAEELRVAREAKGHRRLPLKGARRS